MKANEPNLLEASELFFYKASPQALKLFFYPLCLGHFYYAQGYQLQRESYDSYLLMYILKGRCTVTSQGQKKEAQKGQMVFLDCYVPHGYASEEGWQCLWLHFDGPLAKAYYETLTATQGFVLSPKVPHLIEEAFMKIYQKFAPSVTLQESVLSEQITRLLHTLLPTASLTKSKGASFSEEAIAYIQEHLEENLSLEKLAALVNSSPYHFARTFKKETGQAPHEYVVFSRLHSAKFYLKTTKRSMEEIALLVGFPNASTFCATFKKHMGTTPLKYRRGE
jgi:AraC-like DNA-binding protein